MKETDDAIKHIIAMIEHNRKHSITLAFVLSDLTETNRHPIAVRLNADPMAKKSVPVSIKTGYPLLQRP